MLELGAHLPLIAFDGTPRDLTAYARHAAGLGFTHLCANDHLLFAAPWLDGPLALAATLEAGAGMTLVTTVALPVIRGPVATAKMLGTLSVLSGGRLIAGLGPGSSRGDYAAVGIPFEERWRRFDAIVPEVRALLAGDELQPRPPEVPIWIASWGSPAGLRRVRRLGDGWLASAYNTTTDAFADHVQAVGLPNAVATMWLHVTESRAERDRVLDEVLGPMLRRSPEEMRALPLLVGSRRECAERLGALAAAGAQRVFVWPVADELRQLSALVEEVMPLAS